MAAVLKEFLSKILDKLADMVIEQAGILSSDLPNEIAKIETTIQNLSLDADKRFIHDSSAAEQLERELKDIMYDADDIYDLWQIMKAEGDLLTPEIASKWQNIAKKLSAFQSHAVAHVQIGGKIKKLNERLLDLEKRSSGCRFNTQAINSSGQNNNPWSHGNRSTGPAFIRSDIVGTKVEESKRKLIDLLIKREIPDEGSSGNNVAVTAAITGVGGIGKTTLARMIFNDSVVQKSFDKRVWLNISKDVNETGLLQRAIAAFGGHYGGLAGDKALLENALKQAVRAKKFLLVLDDVWSENVWNELLKVPLNDGAFGSQVLVTTRNEVVARGMKAQYPPHRVEKLNADDAWILLKKQVVLNETDDAEVDVLKNIGMKIVERCDGLPLAVKVVGGVLLTKSRTKDTWEKVYDHYTWSIAGNNEEINKAVSMSYEDLPSHLKQCLLYCSLFPKDEVIRSGAIIWIWSAEGCLNDKISSKAPEDLGFECYKELVSRNLLEPVKDYYDQSGGAMHDVVRSFAQYKIKDEGILISDEGQDVNRILSTSRHRHLSISNKEVEWDALKNPASLRTLMLFGRRTTGELKDLWNNLSCLRVLHLDKINPVGLPDSLCHFKHLRYLGLRDTSCISTIPQDIGALKFLQTIDLEKCTNISQLPSSILELRKLMYFNIRETAVTTVPIGFGKLEELVHLLGFPTHSEDRTDGWCSLEELGPLSKLRRLDIRGLEEEHSCSRAAKAKLSTKHQLTHLWFKFTSRIGNNGEIEGSISEEEHRRTVDVLGNLCPPTCTEALEIKGYFARGLPLWMRTMSAFESLRRLVLEDYACCSQLPNGLGQLPFLDYFWVKHAPSVQFIEDDFLFPSLGGDANVNDVMQPHHISPAAGAFPKLRKLGFMDMLGWTKWDWEKHASAMPALQFLKITNCKLQHLPEGLAHFTTRMRHMDLRNIQNLVSVENFTSLVELVLCGNPTMERISCCQSLRYIHIDDCPGLLVLQDLPSLQSMDWWDLGAETLPQYLQEAELRRLSIECSPGLLKQISLQDDSEWAKIKHVQQMKAYAKISKGDSLDQHIFYTKEPYSFKAAIGESTGEASIPSGGQQSIAPGCSTSTAASCLGAAEEHPVPNAFASRNCRWKLKSWVIADTRKLALVLPSFGPQLIKGTEISLASESH